MTGLWISIEMALPDMAVGRLPVRTAQEAATVVSKIVEYEQLSGMNEALLVADKVEAEDFDFESASLGIKNTATRRYPGLGNLPRPVRL